MNDYDRELQRLAPQTETQRTIGIVATVAAIACAGWSLLTEVNLMTGITPAVIPAVFCIIATTIVWSVKSRGLLVLIATFACATSLMTMAYLNHALQNKRAEFSQVFEN